MARAEAKKRKAEFNSSAGFSDITLVKASSGLATQSSE